MPLTDGVPQHGIKPAIFAIETAVIALRDAKVLLSDLGESYRPSTTPRTNSRAPGICKPPEQLLLPNREISFESDVWALGCVVFALLGYRYFVDGLGGADHMLEEQTDALGPFPRELWELWTNHQKYFSDNGERKNGKPRRRLYDRITKSIVDLRETTSEGKPQHDEM